MDKNNSKIMDSIKKMKSKFGFSFAPHKHFKILVSFCFVIFFAILFFSASIFYQISFLDAKKSNDGVVIPVPKINQSKLESVLGEYEQKAKVQSSSFATNPSVVDPSK